MTLAPLALLLMTASAGSADAPAEPYVLAIGVNDPGQEGLVALSYADDDAAEAIRLFQAGPGRGFLHTTLDASSRDRHRVVADQVRPLSRAAIRQSVQSLRSALDADLDRGEQPHVIIWLAGHGARDDDGHLSYPLSPTERLTSGTLLEEVIGPLSVAHRVHVIVDTCFAEGLVSARASVEGVSEAEVESALVAQSPARWSNVGVLTGATASTQSYEWNEIGAGVFSALLRAGLRGAADVDGDGAIRYSELVAFASAASEGVRVPEARPRVSGQGPRGDTDAAVAYRSWVGERRELRGEVAELGTVHILDVGGRWLLASHFEPGFVPELWLPADGELYLRARGREHRLQSDGDGGLVIGPALPSTTQPRSLMENALRQGLFSATWGPSYWRGYRAALARPLPIGEGTSSLTEPEAAGLPFAAIGTGAVTVVMAALAVGSMAGGSYLYFVAINETRQVPALNAYAGSFALLGVGAGAAVATLATGAAAAYLAIVWE